MKKIVFFIFVFISFFSCNKNDDNLSFKSVFIPIESVDIPDEFTLGEVHTIGVTYKRPSNCHIFGKFYYAPHNNERTVAVVNTVFERNDCIDLVDETLTATFNFQVTSNVSYIFKFWQGKDDNNEDIFLEIEVPVTN
ncbi:hypothetical protein [Hyunsoonleella pacifica]|uniref:Uncharacterized protein n=1 Tax=Hyunsoonleella pacifica TaxID=1080224 RepID=A0A4Q9FQM5_9FLAO|nr:hypothetical protein [Hyunsoonleella pacifica]TBN16782.1 hypothetical protein EYD46_09140 [Hyunsoonleella pacifica]GGD16432.1 hypothetical protein GCM10011368_18010 [Hyunsoonleella pacifica]